MVYTVTFNPSLDYVVGLDNFETGMVNRAKYEQIMPGGKGINVSIVLGNLGVKNTALGFVAGFTGDEIEQRIREKGVDARFIHVKDGFSRINIKIKATEESEINGIGPCITQDDVSSLMGILDKIVDGDTLIMAGSIPDTLPDSMYMDILERVKDRNIRTAVDATGKLLINVLKYGPFLIKPNNHEMGEIFNTTIDSEEKLIEYGRKLMDMGARNVLISRAGDGAILLCEDKRIIKSQAPKGVVVNSVGAGDSMVAGFIAGYMEQNDFEYALRMGIATGSASAFSKELATKNEVQRLM